MPDNDRVMHANDFDLAGRWPKSVRRKRNQCRDVRPVFLLPECPKDVTSESIDLSDRVRMWMRTSLMPRALDNLWDEVTHKLVARCVGKYWSRSNE